MTLPQIRSLVRELPEDATLHPEEYPSRIFKAVEQVFDLVRQSKKYTLGAAVHRTLHQRLLEAASKLFELIYIDDTRGRQGNLRQQHAQDNIRLFHDIASFLGLSPQQLQQLCCERLPSRRLISR